MAMTRGTQVGVCMSVCLLFVRTVWCQDLVVVENGKSPYRIVVAVDASMQDYHAAQVLQRHIKEMTNVELRIITDDNAVGDAEIIVGLNRHATRLGPDPCRDEFGPEEFRIRTTGRHVLVTGGSPRGVLYGVNSLLTDNWGCRWFAPGLKRIPKVKRLTIEATDRRYAPPFEWRDCYFWSGRDNEWAFHSLQNKDFAKLRPEQGGRAGLSHIYFTHTALYLVPPKKYQKDHPDYFWTGTGDQPRSGRTTTEGRQNWIGLCLSHPDVAKIAADALVQARRDWPEGDLYYGIAGSDYDDWCECPRCKARYRKDGGAWPYGSSWLQFAGDVRTHLNGRPDAPKISVLAYGYAAMPPTRPLHVDDVNVLYAELGACQFHALDDPDCPNSAEVRQRISGWKESSDSVYVWLYKMNFDGWFYVHPNLHTLADDLRYLSKAGVDGVFFQGNQMGWDGQRFDGEFGELRAYMVARLMWNPDLDWRALRREFCAAYYGEAAGAVIEQYIDDVCKSLPSQGVHGRASFGKEVFAWVTSEMIARWYGHFERAESLAADEEHKKLVRIARLPVQFTEGNLAKDPARRKALLQRMLDDGRALGAATTYSEGDHFIQWAEREGLEWK